MSAYNLSMLTQRSIRSMLCTAIGVGLVAALPAHAADEAARAFFQGKQVRFYTMGSPGGGYDAYMRALIPHIEKRLSAKLIPTNEPSAGGLIAVNPTINAAPDGLTFLQLGDPTLVTAHRDAPPPVNPHPPTQPPPPTTPTPPRRAPEIGNLPGRD